MQRRHVSISRRTCSRTPDSRQVNGLSLGSGGFTDSEPGEPSLPGIQEGDEQAAVAAWLHSSPVGAMPPAVQSQLATLIAQYEPEDAVWKSLFQGAPDTAVLTMVRCSRHMSERYLCE